MNETHWRRKLASWLLAVTLLLSLCTGCGISPPEDDTDGDTDDKDADVAQFSDLYWEDVTTGAEIETLNVVLVIDTSTSTLRNDQARNWLESACMFLNTLYASAGGGRLPGHKNANVDVILYNDTIASFSETPISLATNTAVTKLKDL